MALISVQRADNDGTAVAFAAVNASDTFQYSGDARLHVKNGSGASINVTLTSPNPCSFGVTHTAHDDIIAVAAGAEQMIKIDKDKHANAANGIVTVNYSAVTSVTAALVA
jgi:hypothetical protein